MSTLFKIIVLICILAWLSLIFWWGKKALKIDKEEKEEAKKNNRRTKE